MEVKKHRRLTLKERVIIQTLLDFPNEIKFSELKEEFDKIYDSFHDNYDELEEIDEDVF